jgi:hypothetical protein
MEHLLKDFNVDRLQADVKVENFVAISVSDSGRLG